MHSLFEPIIQLMPATAINVPGIGSVELAPYLLAVITFAVISVAFKILQSVVLVRLRALSKRTKTDIDDVFIGAIESVRPWVYMLVALYVSLQPFVLPVYAAKILLALVLFALVWQAIEVVVQFVDYAARRFIEKDEDGDGQIDPNAATASHMVTLMARIVLWSLGTLFVLSNLGIEITSLIAGLGIGGVAVAFALQGILSDLFASFSIYFDKPFRIGDFIVIGSDMGTVERIGIKTTRIRTLQGEELVVSNAELTTTRVQNYKKMRERRIVFQFGITYETPREKVRQVPAMVRKIIDDVPNVRVDRVHFANYGDFALLFEAVYFVESGDYNQYMDRHQEINLAIMDAFAEHDIEFAYPTQTLYVKQ